KLMGNIRQKFPSELLLVLQGFDFLFLGSCPVGDFLLYIINRIVAGLFAQRLFQVFAQFKVMYQFIDDLDLAVDITFDQIVEDQKTGYKRNGKSKSQIVPAVLK